MTSPLPDQLAGGDAGRPIMLGPMGESAGAVPDVGERPWWGRHVHELRWQAELARLLVDPVYRGEGVARGDGGPVLLIPGFLAGDVSLAVMAEWLRRMGHRPTGSGMRLNVDCSNRTLLGLERRLHRVAERAGRRVALVGHSRGGHFAKALGHRRPELVSRVVSMGAGLDTPFAISQPTLAAVAVARAIHARTTDRRHSHGCFTSGCRCDFAHHYRADFPADIPLTSIYSKGDGVVRWQACVVPYARCVEVTGSHVGMAVNRKAYRALAEALA
jgi:triacylglycerol lipase